MKDPKCTTPDCPGIIKMGIHNFLAFDLLDNDGDSTDEERTTDASVYAHICDTCDELIDIGIEDPRELDAGVAQMRAAIEKAVQILDHFVGHYQCTMPRVLREVAEELERSLA